MHAPTTSGELEDLFHRLPVALYRTSADGEVLAANHATASLLGYQSLDELLSIEGFAEKSHVDPAERAEWRRRIEQDGVVRDFPIRLQRKDDSVLWVRDTARAVYAEDGSVRFYEGVLTDITEEIQASISSSILSGVLESTTDYVVVFDDSGVLRFANSASRSFLGLSEEAVVNRPSFADIMPHFDWEAALAVTTPRGWSGEITLRDAEGRPSPLWVVVTRHDGRDGASYVAGIGRDLSHVKRTQRRLEELVTAKDVFVATVSHELRNPLTGVMGLAEELRDGFAEFGDQERHDLITLIAHQAGEMTSLVEDLLVAIRSDVGDVAIVPERIDVTSQVTDLSSSISQLRWEPPSEPVSAWADPQRFRQIVRNLLSNAERHGGSRMKVEVDYSEDVVIVTVSDDGEGVTPEDRERIFEPYQRADGTAAKRGSIGLGLSVSRRLARLMGGDLEYLQSEGWTSFRLTVPAAGELPVGRP